MTYAMVDLYCASYARPPAAVTLAIDDTCDTVHGNQQLALFHAHYNERCFPADPRLRHRHLAAGGDPAAAGQETDERRDSQPFPASGSPPDTRLTA